MSARKEMVGSATLLNIDCIEYMRSLPDGAFDLAIVDPPYGLGTKLTRGGGQHLKFKNHKEIENWDVAPSLEYFDELRRVSKNQIIWGGNYFDLPPCRGFIIWDKQQSVPNFSACEFAWNSIDGVSKIFRYRQAGCFGETKIHPTQKPVDLYEWLLSNYSKAGHRILDTHGGSMSSVIAALKLGIEIVCCELDETYFDAAVARVRESQWQVDMFAEMVRQPEQVAII
jgi:site-specific DNA-methyltransferase (adenine-specific)